MSKNHEEYSAVDVASEDTMEDKYLIFRIDDEEYGIAIRDVIEIIGIQNITDLPDMPPFVKGVINLRGKVIPIIDVRLRFGIREREYDRRTCIIVVSISDVLVGMIVDSVSEVIDIPPDDIEPPPTIRKGEASRFIKGLGKVEEDVKILLSTDKLLFDDEIGRISDALPVGS